MKKLVPADLRTSFAFVLAALLAMAASETRAFPAGLNAWQARYGAISPSGDNAGCQLCHANANGGSPWNAYGWDIVLALDNASCDLNADGNVVNDEAFFCVELLNSDRDTGSYDNVTEIGLGKQPGWTVGASNTLYSIGGTTTAQLAPAGIGPVDPDGTEPPPPPPPPPPSEEEMFPPGQIKRRIIFVKPGQSIQAAINQARPGTRIYVFPGEYRELADRTNGLHISKNGIRLIGLKHKKKRVVLKNAGNQRNGIVVVPPERTDCMSCHTSMAPPFELHPGVEPGMKDSDPVLYGLEVRGITLDGFTNNGLFTERVDGFKIIDVESIGSKNYGIFPTLSRNGLIANSRATGSDDSGIWVETSQRVLVTHNVVEGNVNGFEVSNSDDIVLAHNVARNNSIGMAILLLPDIFDDRAGAKRITMWRNWISDNNKPNTARPGSILASVPEGIGILHLGVDDSLITGNRIENNNFAGVAIVDYCLAVFGTPFSCGVDSTITPEFLADQEATNNRVIGNTVVNNGLDPVSHPFEDAASDLGLLTLGDHGNCFQDNVFGTFFSIFSELPPCE